MTRYTFEKKQWGAVFLTETPETGLARAYALNPDRDILTSVDGR